MNFSQKDEDRFWKKVNKKGEDECWDWTAGLGNEGYGKFTLNGKSIGSHRCSLFLAHAAQPLNKTFGLHTCKENKKCCNPNHLYYGDNQDNSNDKKKDNTMCIGILNGNCKLTEEQVREIRQKYIPYKYSLQKLATEYNMSKQMIGFIINNKSWKHL